MNFKTKITLVNGHTASRPISSVMDIPVGYNLSYSLLFFYLFLPFVSTAHFSGHSDSFTKFLCCLSVFALVFLLQLFYFDDAC